MKKYISILVVLFAGLQALAQESFTMPLSDDGEAVLYGFLPARPSGRAVVCCPGGGYQHLAMDHEGFDWKDFFNDRGVAFFVLKYRMPEGDKTIPMGDALKALETVRAHAKEWKVNPNDVGIMGSSAGGHLAAITSTRSGISVRPAFQILFYPVTTMDLWGGHEGSSRNFLGSSVNVADSVVAYSAQAQVKRHTTPPAIILMSADDSVVPVAYNGIAYAQSLLLLENDVTLHMFPSGGHGWGHRPSFEYHTDVIRALSDWLDKLPAPAPDARKVACIGDSITDGHMIFPAFTEGYPAVLQKMLGNGYMVRNFGVSARTLMDSGDHPYRQEPAYAECLEFCPDIAVIKLGTNDSKAWNWVHKADFEKDLQAMVDDLKALPSKPEIYLCIPARIWENGYGIDGKVVEKEMAPMIRKVAKKNGLKVIDFWSAMPERDCFFWDGVHPNSKGAARMAEIAAAAIAPSE